MSGDKLVFDLANEVEDVPNIFVRKDWINILDNQNGNYNSNQSVIDTSQLSNSNKYMSYREAYLAVPMVLTLTSAAVDGAMANSANKSTEFAIGLKNWFGSVIHSLTLDFNGTTIIQQTPFINMWNSFKLMTTLSWQDVASLGSTMGFYPDDPLSWSYGGASTHLSGKGVCNNTNMRPPFNVLGTKVGANTSTGSITGGTYGTPAPSDNSYRCDLGNEGLLRRQLYITYDADASSGSGTYGNNILSSSRAQQLWKSYVMTKVASATGGAQGIYQVAIMGFIHLRHLHSFFNQIPLIKGAFMKLTLNLNNTSVNFNVMNNAGGNGYQVSSVSNSVGGVNPVMLASRRKFDIGCFTSATTSSLTRYANGGSILNQTVASETALDATTAFIASLFVGQRCLNPAQITAGANSISSLSPSIILYVPSYSFNAVFEQAYISSPIKKVIYEDIYQYQVLGIQASSGQINHLLTNGISNLRSVLILPFYSAGDNSDNTTTGHLCASGVPVYQSPFDPAGTGPTSPLCILNNFNVVVSGQNVIYNTERYGFEQFINQTYGQNAINAGMTEGLNSALIDQLGWEMEYCYHYVDVSRMLPVEQQVPKSVQIIGQNNSVQSIDLFCFLSYGCELSFDVVSGSRV